MYGFWGKNLWLLHHTISKTAMHIAALSGSMYGFWE